MHFRGLKLGSGGGNMSKSLESFEERGILIQRVAPVGEKVLKKG